MATTTVRTTRRNRQKSSLFFAAVIAIAALVTFGAYAASSGSSTLTITPPSTTSGAKADVTSVATTFSGVQGKGKKTKGVVLSKLTFGNSGDSDDVFIDFIWSDPDQASGALKNRRAFLETRVYQVGTGCAVADQRTFTDGGSVTVCPDPDARHNFKAISIFNPAAQFLPSVDAQSVLYILADIVVPGGAPPGQQSQLTQLEFIVSIS